MVKWTLTSGAVTVEVIATDDGLGNITFTYELLSGIADLNGFFIDVGNDGGDISRISGGNNMRGSDSNGNRLDGFDIAEEIGTVGGNDADTTSGFLTFTMEELGISSLADLADAEIGIRATSVGECREDSLKLAATGTYCPVEPPSGDDFPEWAQDISHVVFVFNQTIGDVSGDGYYTIKVDFSGAFVAANGNDLDDYIDDFLFALINDDTNVPFLNSGADLMGVVIKGGGQMTEYYAYGDHNLDGTDPDPLPSGMGFLLPGNNGPVDPTSEIDLSLELDSSGDFIFS
ncbi:hypothetical protein [Ruegeria marina]|nr:hypothetical protein [Ruegeria marina]